MDEEAKVKTRENFMVGKISSRPFGSFVKYMENVVYTGIYGLDHETAGGDRSRQDVLSYAKELELGVIRYPGGNFTSGYDGVDTVGRKEQGLKRIDLAGRGVELNFFGLHEFFKWISHVQTKSIFTVNLGTKGIDEVKNLVEYCSFPKGVLGGDLRIENGQKKPSGVKLWCLGNELDGPGQVGVKSAYEYSRLANEASRVMKLVDDSTKTILVRGSTSRLLSYFGGDRIALEEAYENVDHLALHNYIDKYGGEGLTKPPKNECDDTATYLVKAYRFNRQVKEVVVICDYVKGYLRSEKTIYLAFDEWNVHVQPGKRHRDFEVGSPIDWCYLTTEDTLLFSSLGLAILRHADCVRISCQSSLVNAIPLILTDVRG